MCWAVAEAVWERAGGDVLEAVVDIFGGGLDWTRQSFGRLATAERSGRRWQAGAVEGWAMAVAVAVAGQWLRMGTCMGLALGMRGMGGHTVVAVVTPIGASSWTVKNLCVYVKVVRSG